jgi:hypothetical protein
MEDRTEQLEEANDTLLDIDSSILDLRDSLIDSYLELEDRTVAALETIRQNNIDEQQKINEAIDEASSDLMDAISKNIDKIRQDRENEKTEQSISDKETRLAYLRQDTTGAHDLEIKALEKELIEDRESY